MKQEPWTRKGVKFRPNDKVTETLHNDLLVISIRLNRYEVRWVLLGTGSSVNLLTLEVYNKLGIDKNNLPKVSDLLVGLGDKTVAVLGTINLPLVLRNKKYKRKIYVEFVVLDIPLAYNVILGSLVLNYYGIVINMGSLCWKLPVPSGLTVVEAVKSRLKSVLGTLPKVSGR